MCGVPVVAIGTIGAGGALNRVEAFVDSQPFRIPDLVDYRASSDGRMTIEARTLFRREGILSNPFFFI